MPSTFKIYLIQNIEDGKVYVGKTSRTSVVRWNEHIKNSLYGSDFYIHNAIRKHGLEMFKIRQIDEVETEDLANQRETYWITQIFKSHLKENGYNLTTGGEGTPGHKGNVGRVCSEETRRKISIAQIGKIISLETRQKQSLAKIGKPASIETKKKLSGMRQGEKSPCYRKDVTKEQIIQLRQENLTNIKIANKLGCSLQTIHRRLNG